MERESKHDHEPAQTQSRKMGGKIARDLGRSPQCVRSNRVLSMGNGGRGPSLEIVRKAAEGGFSSGRESALPLYMGENPVRGKLQNQ